MQLSIVDLSVVSPGTTEKEALEASIQDAKHADAAGFHRYWFAQHHLGRSGASHYPQLLIAAAARETSSIRLGSGAMLMNNHSPFTLAESFKQLEAMAPGRIDLGIGRAGGLPALDLAIQQDRAALVRPDHEQQLREVLAWLHDDFPPQHPFAALGPIVANVRELPDVWLLGSSVSSARLAGALGIGYTFAGFIAPGAAAAALQTYRAAFRDGGVLSAPRSILAVHAVAGEDADDAQRLVSSVKGFYARLGRGDRHPIEVMVPSPEQAEREMTAAQAAERTEIVDAAWPRFVAGDATEVRRTLERMVDESAADELMIQDSITDVVARRRSRAAIADAFGVRRVAPAGSAAR